MSTEGDDPSEGLNAAVVNKHVKKSIKCVWMTVKWKLSPNWLPLEVTIDLLRHKSVKTIAKLQGLDRIIS